MTRASRAPVGGRTRSKGRARIAPLALVAVGILAVPPGARADNAARGSILHATDIPSDAQATGSLALAQRSGATSSLGIRTNVQRPSPTWSPDGQRLAFAAIDEAGTWQPPFKDIYVAGADGSGVRRIISGPGSEESPDFSPDGRKIAYTVVDSGDYSFLSVVPTTSEIWVSNADGSAPMPLSRDGARDFNPAWSPEGRSIAFSSARGGDRDIYVMDADGSRVRQLTAGSADDDFPAWSPDGARIAWTHDVAYNRGQLWTMNSKGRQARLLTQSHADWNPSWSPDGRRIAFERRISPEPWYEYSAIYLVDRRGRHQRQLVSDGFEPEWRPALGAAVAGRGPRLP